MGDHPETMSENSENKCAICGREQDSKYRPFCSSRCANIDLNRWLGGTYAIPAVEDSDDWSESNGDPSISYDNDN